MFGSDAVDDNHVSSINRNGQTRHLLSYMVPSLLAVLIYVSVTISYTEGSVFASGTTAITDMFSYVGFAGAGGSLFLFLGLLLLCNSCAVVFRESVSRVRLWSIACGTVLALTLTFHPFTVSTHAGDQTSMGYTPPTVPAELKTSWYYLYLTIRFTGCSILLSLCLCVLFSWCMGKRVRNVVFSEHMMSLLHQIHDVFLTSLSPLVSRARIMTWYSSLLLGGIILLCWVPWIVLLSPSNIGPDTIAQLVWARTGQAWDPSNRQNLPGYAMSDQHPWFDTLIYGAFYSFGQGIGHVTFALWLMAFLHAVCIALSLGVMLNYLCSVMKISSHWCMMLLLFYGLVPVFGRLSVSVVKDLTCMPFFILWLTMFMEYVRRIKDSQHIRVPFMIGFLILAVMCSLTRKLSLYIIVFTMLCCIVILKRRLFSLLYAVILALVMTIVPNIVFPVLHVAPAGSQEMLAIPLQQSVHLLLTDKDVLSGNDRQVIENMFSCSMRQLEEKYSPGGSDPIKDCFNREATAKQVHEFLIVWFRQGITHVPVYLEAVPWIRDSFTMGTVYDERFHVWWGWEERGGNLIFPEYKSHEKSTLQRYGQALYLMTSKMPLLGLLMSEATYVVWLPMLAIALCVLRRRTDNLVLLIPFILTIATVLIDPAHQSRYTWTLLYNSAIMMALPFVQFPSQNVDAA